MCTSITVFTVPLFVIKRFEIRFQIHLRLFISYYRYSHYLNLKTVAWNRHKKCNRTNMSKQAYQINFVCFVLINKTTLSGKEEEIKDEKNYSGRLIDSRENLHAYHEAPRNPVFFPVPLTTNTRQLSFWHGTLIAPAEIVYPLRSHELKIAYRAVFARLARRNRVDSR